MERTKIPGAGSFCSARFATQESQGPSQPRFQPQRHLGVGRAGLRCQLIPLMLSGYYYPLLFPGQNALSSGSNTQNKFKLSRQRWIEAQEPEESISTLITSRPQEPSMLLEGERQIQYDSANNLPLNENVFLSDAACLATGTMRLD